MQPAGSHLDCPDLNKKAIYSYIKKKNPTNPLKMEGKIGN